MEREKIFGDDIEPAAQPLFHFRTDLANFVAAPRESNKKRAAAMLKSWVATLHRERSARWSSCCGVKTERGVTVFCSQGHDLVRIPVPPKQVESRRSKLYVSWQQVRCNKCGSEVADVSFRCDLPGALAQVGSKLLDFRFLG